ncbi:MAG: glycosyltransferase family 4 protein [Proteobacteria bacterium]|nr:glycosyltransferase family 4 protein [Pseudomonadota bacterium]
MKILFVAHQGDLGGATTPVVEAIDALSPRGHKFAVLMPEPGSLSEALDARKVPWTTCPVPPWCSTNGRRRFRNIRANWRAFMAVRTAIRAAGADLVVSNSIVIGVAARACVTLNLAHMWWLHEFATEDHNLEFDWGRYFTPRIAARSCIRAFANSDAVARKFEDWFGPGRVGRVDYFIKAVPPGDAPAFEPAGAFHLALVGSLNPQKGQADAIAAMGRLAAAGRDVHLHLYGTGGRGYTARLKAAADAQGVGGRVHFHGHVADVPARVARADAALVTSRCEAFGRVTVEAMRAGVPVIGTGSGGTPELVADGATGLLYPPGDAAALAAAIGRLIDDPALARRLGEAGRDWATPRFGEAQFADALEAQFAFAR